MIRQLFAILVFSICFFTSCKEEEKPPVAADKEKVKDTSITVKEEVIPYPYIPIDKSPMDMSYFPVDYPKLRMANPKIGAPVMRVIYSRPHLNGRNLFNDLLKHGENWRLGANEATEIQFFREVSILEKKIRPGRYILYCIPHPDKWTFVINSNIDSWGLEQDDSKDVARLEVELEHQHVDAFLEDFTMIFEKKEYGADLLVAWGRINARLPVNFK